ncbi:nucleotidyltransferase family protein [candidate division WOR-3 bacterium]|uniref:Nucleotidyltransferase family protein n=1 Tax=candidate division WOR-3 bacterium TaxID=2052148 RepID=A0A937XI04_UNCW3|nr:nucleotidyltransferase family protein [candidate division WOR-3 bacterium]
MENPRSAADLLLSYLSDPRPRTRNQEPVTDWNEVVSTAAYHGLAPLLFSRLKKSEVQDYVPADAWERLRQAYFASASRSGLFYRRLVPVLRCLRDSGIPVIAMKGVYLAEQVYGNLALRPMCDADLMVPRAELPRAIAALFDSGGAYQLSEHFDKFDWAVHHHARPLVVRELTVEIHWTLVPPTGAVRVDTAGLWERARPVTIARVEVLALSSEDLILHLCLSLGHQGFTGLKRLCDMAETLHRFRGEIDWARVVSLAHRWGASKYAGLTFHLARNLLGAAVPDDVLEQLVPGGLDRRKLETAQESIVARTDCLRSGSIIDRWGAMSMGGKARLSWERVFLPRGEMAVVYPESRKAKHLWPYYALRLRDVVRTLLAHLFRRGLPTARSGMEGRNAALANWLEDRMTVGGKRRTMKEQR